MEKNLNCVWVTNDDSIARLPIRKRLQKEGFCAAVIQYGNGKYFLDAFESKSSDQRRPDLIILDLNMPIMDGWTFLDSIKAHNFNINLPHIAILTTSIDKEDYNLAQVYSNIISFLRKTLNLVNLKEDLKSLAA